MAGLDSPDASSANASAKATKSSEAHLARVRDNQRRSRARRKQYLADLESKYRRCEQHGAAATTEMQAAARKVLDENARLRLLLSQNGVTDVEVNLYSTSGDVQDVPLDSGGSQHPTAAQLLTRHLTEKRECPEAFDHHGGRSYSSSDGTGSRLKPELDSHSPATSSKSFSLDTLSSNIASDSALEPQTIQSLWPSWRMSSTDMTIDSNRASPMDFPSSVLDSEPSEYTSHNVAVPCGGNNWHQGQDHTRNFDLDTGYSVLPSNDPRHSSVQLDMASDHYNTDNPMHMLLSPDRHSRFMRYLGMQPQPPILSSESSSYDEHVQQRQEQPLRQASSAPDSTTNSVPARAESYPQLSASVSTAFAPVSNHMTPPSASSRSWSPAYCHRTREWKRLDDPCWIICSMMAAGIASN